MKKSYLFFTGLLAICLCSWAFIGLGSSSFEVPESRITFHQVNLVCGAATDIGCGSRSKPILLDLEKEASIKEAWLNRQGTIVAVVWKDGVESNVKAVPTIFKKHGKSIETLEGSEYEKQLNSFKKDKWYKRDAVNELSFEEAGRIATRIIEPIKKASKLMDDKASSMHKEVEQYIYNQFMILEDVSVLSSMEYYNGWTADIKKIVVKYIPESEMPEIQVCGSSSSSCKNTSKSCCSKGKKCCSSSWWSSLFN